MGHVFAYLYTLDDDSEPPIDYETSLLPNVFALFFINSVHLTHLLSVLKDYTPVMSESSPVSCPKVMYPPVAEVLRDYIAYWPIPIESILTFLSHLPQSYSSVPRKTY